MSNFEAWLEDLLALLGVRDRFPVRVISGIEGYEKPDPRMFRVALDRRGSTRPTSRTSATTRSSTSIPRASWA